MQVSKNIFAIPYIYSFRKGVQASARYDEADTLRPAAHVLLSQIAMDDSGSWRDTCGWKPASGWAGAACRQLSEIGPVPDCAV